MIKLCGYGKCRGEKKGLEDKEWVEENKSDENKNKNPSLQVGQWVGKLK